MDPQIAVDIGRQAVLVTLLLGAPVLIVSAVVGIVVGLLQTLTQTSDQTVLFVVRLIAAVAVLSICMPWLIDQYTGYSRELFEQIPEMVTGRQPR